MWRGETARFWFFRDEILVRYPRDVLPVLDTYFTTCKTAGGIAEKAGNIRQSETGTGKSYVYLRTKVRDNILIGTPPSRYLRVKITAAP